MGYVSLRRRCLDFTAKTEKYVHAAQRQQTGFATIVGCNDSGKQRTCGYLFWAGERQYGGRASVGRDTDYGQVKFVYYDSGNPSVNALEDLGAKGRTDRNIAFLLTFGVVGLPMLFLYANSASANADSPSGTTNKMEEAGP
jgi:hypothetical protein